VSQLSFHPNPKLSLPGDHPSPANPGQSADHHRKRNESPECSEPYFDRIGSGIQTCHEVGSHEDRIYCKHREHESEYLSLHTSISALRPELRTPGRMAPTTWSLAVTIRRW
jgi:hypothetical protein